MNRTSLQTVGKTAEGKEVVAGLYKIHADEGIPLDMVFNYCLENNIVPDWISLYKDARSQGMKHDRIISKLEESIIESFGSKWAETVISTLNKVFKGNG